MWFSTDVAKEEEEGGVHRIQVTRKTAVDQKQLESFEMWCWKRMEKISRNDRVRNEVLHRVKEQRDIVHEIRKRGG